VVSGNAPKRSSRSGGPRPGSPTRLQHPPSGAKPDLASELEVTRQELGEALDQQAALRDVLGVISQSPFALGPVLDAVIQNAVRLSDADSGSLVRIENEVGLLAAHVGMSDERVAQQAEFYQTHPHAPGRSSLTGRVLMERRSVQIRDTDADHEYVQPFMEHPRSMLGVPLLRPEGIAGVIVVRRETIGGFSAQQVKLVEAFAAQAVIAMENVRLFNETKESLEQQRAISEILSAISIAGSDVKPVFDAVVHKAGVLCNAEWSLVWQRQTDGFHLVSSSGSTDSFLETQRDRVEVLTRDSLVGRTALEKRPVHIPDVLADPEYGLLDDQLAGGYRTTLGVPILHDGEVIGVIALSRNQVRPFTERQVALVVTFADQAAIAIENVRLFQAVERQRQELTRFVSPQVASLLTSDEGQRLLEGHRRAITVLFCDLRGFSPFSETAEPEEVLGVLREYHAAMGELIVTHGGTLEHFAGDGMMVFFNDPVLVPDHEFRAVRLAVAMRTRFEAMAQAWHRKGYELGFGIGAAVGHATLGRIGFEGRYDYGAIGNAVIVASRLSGEAKAGQILLTQRLLAAVEERVDAEAIGELSLKGQSRPTAAYNVMALHAPE